MISINSLQSEKFSSQYNVSHFSQTHSSPSDQHIKQLVTHVTWNRNALFLFHHAEIPDKMRFWSETGTTKQIRFSYASALHPLTNHK